MGWSDLNLGASGDVIPSFYGSSRSFWQAFVELLNLLPTRHESLDDVVHEAKK